MVMNVTAELNLKSCRTSRPWRAAAGLVVALLSFGLAPSACAQDPGFMRVNIEIPEADLFGSIHGLYARGPQAYFDSTAGHWRNANWERSWERDCTVEVFDDTGALLIDRPAGLKIFGGMSRYYPEKSLRIIARTQVVETDGDSVLHWPEGFHADVFGTGAQTYKHLVLRHSGNDYRSLRFKDALLTSLAAETGLDVQASAPAHLYVNSEYWGVYNLREKINKYYFSDHYQLPFKGLDILQGGRTVEHGSDEAYNDLLRFVRRHPMALDSNFQQVQQLMDTRNFTNFWICQLFFSNRDVRGNIRFWRSEALDGRFRWIVYDTDLGFFPDQRKHNMLAMFTSKEQTVWYNPSWATGLLRALLENEGFRDDFILQATVLLNTVLSPANVERRIDDFEALYEPAMERHFAGRRKFQSNQGSIEKWRRKVEDLHVFALERPQYLMKHLAEVFELGETFVVRLNVEGAQHGQVVLNGQRLDFSRDSTFEGQFFRSLELPLALLPRLGYHSAGDNPASLRWVSSDTLSLDFRFEPNPPSDVDVVLHELDLAGGRLELFNREQFPVDISGWSVDGGGGNPLVFHSTLIPSYGFAVMNFGEILSSDSASFARSHISLFDALARPVDQATFADAVLFDAPVAYGFERIAPLAPKGTDASLWQASSTATIGAHNPPHLAVLEARVQGQQLRAVHRAWRLAIGLFFCTFCTGGALLILLVGRGRQF